MPISFPRNDIMALLKSNQVDFMPIRRDLIARTARQTYAKELAAPLWRATITSEPLDFGEGMQLQAALESLRGALNTCYVYDARLPYPQSNPSGSFSDSASLSGVQNGNEIRLSGLPVDLTPGDYLAFDWGAGPSRALHRVLEPVSAGSGAYFSVEPGVLTGSGGPSVTLKQPSMLATLVSDFSSQQVNTRQVSYTVEFVQVL